MRSALLGSVSAVLAGATLTFAQLPPPTNPTPQPIAGSLPLTLAPSAAQSGPPAADNKPASPASSEALSAEQATWGTDGEPRFGGPPLPPPGRFYAEGQFLLWFSKPNSLPPLVTTGQLNDVSSTAAVGEQGTKIIFGQDAVDASTRLGARLRAGVWLDSEETFAIEAGGFVVEASGTNFAASSDGTLPLGLPYANADGFRSPETSLLLAAPGQFSGSVNVSTRNTVWGAEADARFNLAGGPRYRADLLAGVCYMRLTDDFLSSSSTTALPPPDGLVQFGGQVFPAPARVSIFDHFRTRNDFYGAQIGGQVELREGPWFADFRGTLGIGGVHQALTIDGSTTLNVPGSAPQTAVGGLFAQASNIGKHTRNEFGIVPEAGITLGYQVTSFLRVTLGYSAVYFRNDVLRTGAAIDRVVSQSQIPAVFGPAPPGTQTQPTVLLNNVDFWVQGAHFGIEIDF
jgi:Putative beta barrel porin-7 (BBP7)